MPKHAPSFKHLLTATSPPQQVGHREKSVNDLIANSRVHYPAQRDLPPHTAQGERVWTPSTGVGGLLGVEDGGVHPAELLRRSYVSQRQASRSVAGPAPPPSWRSPTADTAASSSGLPSMTPQLVGRVTTSVLREASSLFTRSMSPQQIRGSLRLVEYCLYTVLRYLNDDEMIQSREENEAADTDPDGSAVWTRGELLREQATYLESQLKSALLHLSSILPEGSELRLIDASLKAILGYIPSTEQRQAQPLDRPDEWDRTSSKSPESEESADTTLHHLALTLHPSPHSFLRLTPSFQSLSLTSLNLAYSTVPMELEKLVSVLPASLRELGMVGVRVRKGKTSGQEEWRRGLGVLGRKLIVLRMLDLSYPPFDITTQTLTTLLHPPSVKLPSLRVLGLRGILRASDGRINEDIPLNDTQTVSTPRVEASDDVVRQWRSSIKSGRQRWVDVIWY